MTIDLQILSLVEKLGESLRGHDLKIMFIKSWTLPLYNSGRCGGAYVAILLTLSTNNPSTLTFVVVGGWKCS